MKQNEVAYKHIEFFSFGRTRVEYDLHNNQAIMTLNQNRRLLIGAACWFNWFSLLSYTPILAPYVKSLDASYQMVGIVLSTYGFVQMLLRLPLGIIADKYNTRTSIISGLLFLCTISAIGLWMWPNIYATLIFRTLSGVAATVWILQPVVFSSCFSSHETSKAMGAITAIINCGEMAGMLAGGIVAQYWGFGATFLLAALSGGVAFLFSLLLKDEPIVIREPIRVTDLLTIAHDRRLNLTGVLGLLLQLVIYGTIYGFTPIIAKKMGLSNLELGILSTMFMLPGILAAVLSGSFFTRQIGELRSIVGGFIILAITCMIIPYANSKEMLFFWQAVQGFVRGLIYPLLIAMGLRYISAAKRTTAMGYSQTIFGLGIFLGPLIVGIFGDIFGLEWGFVTIGFFSLTGALLAFWQRATLAQV
ncbi:MAG: MFS transporter [Negativicutes bacterium]